MIIDERFLKLFKERMLCILLSIQVDVDNVPETTRKRIRSAIELLDELPDYDVHEVRWEEFKIWLDFLDKHAVASGELVDAYTVEDIRLQIEGIERRTG